MITSILLALLRISLFFFFVNMDFSALNTTKSDFIVNHYNCMEWITLFFLSTHLQCDIVLPIKICSLFHHSLESGLALWLALTNTMWQKWSCTFWSLEHRLRLPLSCSWNVKTIPWKSTTEDKKSCRELRLPRQQPATTCQTCDGAILDPPTPVQLSVVCSCMSDLGETMRTPDYQPTELQ